MTNAIDHCWVIHDGAAGNRRQAIALAQALGWAYEEKVIAPRTWPRWFAPRILPFSKNPFGDDFNVGLNTPPRYVIGCGRQAALATRLLKQAGSFAIQILNPHIRGDHWDAVIAPIHDRVSGDNVIHSLGSLHEINSEFLAKLRVQTCALASLKSPRTAVFIGGPSRMAHFDEGLLEVMFGQLEYDIAKNGSTLIICGSRRTPKIVAEIIRQRFSDSHFPLWFDDSDGENIYHQALAYADRIVITPDSVNMISEACATDVPVFIAQPNRANKRMTLFLDALRSKARIQTQTRELNPFPVTALHTLPDVITQLRRFM